MKNRQHPNRVVTLLSGALLLASVANADNRIIPPSPVNALPEHKSYEEWSAAWWQWVMTVPSKMNPVTQHGNQVDCSIFQNPFSPVFFLTGDSGFTDTRSCTVPFGKPIFFPVVNLLNDYPCPSTPSAPFQPGPGQSLEQFLTIGYRVAGLPSGARPLIDANTVGNGGNLGATLDNVPLAPTEIVPPPAASTYRATSPLFLFRADSSLNQFDACVTGGIQPGVSDGYWIMLAPLSPGNHTLVIKQPVSSSSSVLITYHLFVPNH